MGEIDKHQENENMMSVICQHVVKVLEINDTGKADEKCEVGTEK